MTAAAEKIARKRTTPPLPILEIPVTPTESLIAERPLLAPPTAQFPVDPQFNAAELATDLSLHLERFMRDGEEDPFTNPVFHLALEIEKRLATGGLDFGKLEQLVQYLSAEGFLTRARRFAGKLGETEPDTNTEHLRRLVQTLAHDKEGNPLPFAAFRRTVEREAFGIVITAHPTFTLSGELMETLAVLATGRGTDGVPLTAELRSAMIARMAESEHRPDADISLTREHALSVQALTNIQVALRRLYTVVFEAAAVLYPEHWTELTPKLITVASWVGYDLDGRSDITWTDTLHKRLTVQVLQLRHYLNELVGIRNTAPDDEELRHTLEQIESRLVLAIHEVMDEIQVFALHDPDTADAHRHIQRIGKRMHEDQAFRLISGGMLVERVNRAIRLLRQHGEMAAGAVLRLSVLRAELENFGLGIAHTHVRINSTQLHNAIRKVVGLETAPDDPRYRQSYLERLTTLLDEVQPVSINFGSLITERTSAKRLFMIVAQMLKYSDSTTPIRFLIAESETAFTVLTALYYARLFGVENRLDISPLFETERALELGSRVIDALLENPHYRAYVEKRGRLCIQTGYSDAGRYLGQTPAAASIERLRMRVARLLKKHGLPGVQLVIFDTHGESIGRGAHPASLTNRLSYIAPPAWLHFLATEGISFKQEVSFQGGDGFLYFVTETAAFAAVTRIAEYILGEHESNADDPFYEESDYITEIFTTVKEFQVSLMRDPNYAVMLSTIGPALLLPSGSRAFKRQHDSTAENIDQQSATQIRAIPHNAILQQLGLPANVIGGFGAAIDKDPKRYVAMHARSPRFRQLLGVVEYGFAIADPEALKAYIDTLDPGLWLTLAARTGDRGRADEMRQLAAHLEDNSAHVRQMRIYRKLLRDHAELRDGLALSGAGCSALLDPATRTGLRLLHALRLALIHELFRLATHIPDFSSQHETTRERIINRILHLDIPSVVAQLEEIFPATADTEIESSDFGEPATYRNDESQNYRQENERIFRPMTALYEVILRIGAAITQRIGFLG